MINDLLCIRVNTASVSDIQEHFTKSDKLFIPSLSSRLDISEYAMKIYKCAERFEVWDAETLVGLVAVYCNDVGRHTAFITSVSLLNEWSGRGIASVVIGRCIEHIRTLGLSVIKLEVSPLNQQALKLYRRFGFIEIVKTPDLTTMQLSL
jgi:ribosomal protein S18 acetylase RimI-like enzyme